MNPQGVRAHLGSADIYLLEHFQVLNGEFVDPSSGADRYSKAYAYKQKYGTRIATVTTQADSPYKKCDELFDESKFDFAWWSTLLYGFDFMAWGEPSGFSSWGTCSNALPFHVRLNPGDIGVFSSRIVNTQPVYYRNTTAGIIDINTSDHTGEFKLIAPPKTTRRH